MTSSGLAKVPAGALVFDDAILTASSVGGALSKITLSPPIIASTSAPGLPESSKKLIVNGTMPSASAVTAV